MTSRNALGAYEGRPLPREALSPGLCGARLDTLAEKIEEPGQRPKTQLPTARAGLRQANAIVVALLFPRGESQALARIDLMTPADTGLFWRIALQVYIGANRTDFACKKVVGGEELTVFIEIKKADPDGLIASIENQLLEQYMQLGGVDFGIHLTFWFKDGDRFHRPGEWATVADLTRELEREAEDVSLRTRTRIATLVIDTTTPPRTR